MSQIDPNHVHSADCREITETEAPGGGKNLSVRLACGQPDPYIGGEWTGGIKVYRHEDPDATALNDAAGKEIWVVRSVAFKTQCSVCRRFFGRWWKVGPTGLLPTEEDVRTRGRELLGMADFTETGEGWVCPGEGGETELTLELLINEGAPMPGGIW